MTDVRDRHVLSGKPKERTTSGHFLLNQSLIMRNYAWGLSLMKVSLARVVT